MPVTSKIKGSNGQTLPTDRLRSEFQNLLGAVGERAMSSVREKVGGVTERLTDYAENQGGSGLVGAITGVKDIAEGKSPTRSLMDAGVSSLKDKVKNAFGGGKGGKGGKKLKVTSIVESIDIGVPVQVAYNQWTQFSDFPQFMKKVESVEQQSDEKLRWKAQIFWSHRSWESTIISQVPDDHIVWRSKGDKGYVDGAVSFHELAPNLTRVLLVLEYHPQGLFERTGNLWRAQGRRARLELKHFRRHVMSDVITHPDDIEGWRGVIEDGQVVQDHQPADGEEPEDQEAAGADEPQDRESADGEEPRDRESADGDEPEDREPADEEEPEEPEDHESVNGEEPAERKRAPARRRTTTRSGSTSRSGSATRSRSTTRRSES